MVLGMHRSGTSAFTRVLSLAGATLPKRLIGADDISNPTGHWEPDELVKYHDKFLSELSSPADDWHALDWERISKERYSQIKKDIINIIKEDYGDAELFVLKDPRVCRFVPLYKEILASEKIEFMPILIIRNPLEVMDSLTRRENMPRAKSALLWLRHVLEAEKSTRCDKRVFVSYANLMKNWRTEVERVCQAFDLYEFFDLEKAAPLVDNFLTPELRHSIREEQELRKDPALSGWIAETWEALNILFQDTSSTKATKMLDEIYWQFHLNEQLFDRLHKELEQIKFNEYMSRISELEKQSEDMRSVIGELEKKLAHVNDELNREREKVVTLNKSLEEQRAIITELEEKLTLAEEELNSKEKKIINYSKELEEQWSIRRELEKKYAYSENYINSIHNSTSWKITKPLRSLKKIIRRRDSN